MDSRIFNSTKNYQQTPLLLGESPGLFDTVNKHYPQIWRLYKTQKSLDWDENEFDYSSCIGDFKQCSPVEYDMMIKTLAWQWQGDSIAATSIAPVLAPFISSSELWAAWLKVSEIEVTHAATYSEIVRNSFNDPADIINEITNIKYISDRLTNVAEVFKSSYLISHQYALGEVKNNQSTYNAAFMYIVALYCLERIQFMASFAVTFALCNTGQFQPIGKAVQKIAQDESEIHAQLDKAVLIHELTTERGRTALQQNELQIKTLISDVIQSEKEWINYLFSNGRTLVGITPERLFNWTLFCAKDVEDTLGVTLGQYEFPTKNPLKFLDNWLNINKIQPSPQEEQIAAYKLNILTRDDANEVFELDF